ncbi:MAG: type II secretion system F family protein [Rhodospirillaceae bacterium]
MTTMQMLFIAATFIGAVSLTLGVVYLFSGSAARKRVLEVGGIDSGSRTAREWVERVAEITKPFAKLSVPEGNWASSPLRMQFINAGIRSDAAPVVFFAAKTLLATILPAVSYFYLALSGSKLGMQGYLLLLLFTGALGYYLPHLVLRRLVFLRQREIFESFPDALDLLIVCVEAGLAIDAALNRVADEMEHRSEALSEELHLVTLELRAGASKETALRNLALRTGVEDVNTLVAMLIQAERFGTSIADSLRVHADMLRTKRRQRAEEAAAKIALKLLFPLIFCIFPSLLLVLLGPAFIQIYRVLLPTMAGGH